MPDCASDPPPGNRSAGCIRNRVVDLFFGVEKAGVVGFNEWERIERFPAWKFSESINDSNGAYLDKTQKQSHSRFDR